MRGIFVRVYVMGLMLLATGILAIVSTVQVEQNEGEILGLAGWIVEDVWAHRDAPNLDAFLVRFEEDVRARVTFYEPGGELLFRSRNGTRDKLDEADVNRLRSERRFMDGERLVIGFFEGEDLVAYAFAEHDDDSFSIHLDWFGALAVFGVMALLAWPMARSLTKPIHTLANAVDRFGAGDLEARSGIQRHDEVGQLAKGFDAMADRIARLVRAERALLASVSHEFRTPLQRIRLFLELLEDRELLSGREVNAVLADVEELDSLVRDVLFASKLNAPIEDVLLTREPCQLDSLVRERVERFEALHPGRRVHLQGDVVRCEVDARLFSRAVTNLLQNAHKYSPDGAPIEVRVIEDGGRAQVSVADRGVGVPEEQRDRIFEPFYRPEGTLVDGVGLGLALVRRVCELHGATVTHQVREGGGSVFVIGDLRGIE